MKIDIGCGTKKLEGFVGVDRHPFDGVDRVCEVGTDRLPFDDESVDEAYCSHFLEHLTSVQRVRFVNDLYRVLKPGRKATIIVPHWGSNRAYGDPTHQWPPVSEMWFYYLSREWRRTQAPHTDRANWSDGFDCDFHATWGYAIHPQWLSRNVEMQQFAMSNYRDSITDIHATLTKV